MKDLSCPRLVILRAPRLSFLSGCLGQSNCDIIQNKYLIFVLVPDMQLPKPLESPERYEGLLYASYMTGGWEYCSMSPESPRHDWRVGSCSPTPRPQGRREELEIELITNGRWFNQSSLHNGTSTETLNSERFRELPGSWAHWGAERVVSARPCPVHLSQLTVSELNPLW